MSKIILVSKQLNYIYKDTKISVKDLGCQYEAEFIIYSRVHKIHETLLTRLKFRIKNIIDTYEPKR